MYKYFPKTIYAIKFVPLRFSKKILDSVIDILKQSGYRVVVGRGNFQSGYCLLSQKKILVLNTFLDVKAKVEVLVELIQDIDIDTNMLTENQQDFYHKNLVRSSESKKIFS